MATSNVIAVDTLNLTGRDFSQYQAVIYTPTGEVFGRDDNSPLAAGPDVLVSMAEKFVASGYARVIGVKEVNRNDPPTNPAVGDAYVVGPNPTGEWASFPKQIVQRLRTRTWRREVGRFGRKVRNEADNLEYYMNAAGNWVPETSTEPEKDFTIVQGLFNAPPSSATTGQLVIVGPSGTGAFAGQDNNIATKTATGWDFRAPRRNEVTSDADVLRKWNGTLWEERGINSPLINYDLVNNSPGLFTGQTPAGTLELFDEAMASTTDLLEIDISDIAMNNSLEAKPPLQDIQRPNWLLEVHYGSNRLLQIKGGTFGRQIGGTGGVNFRLAANQDLDLSFDAMFLRSQISGLTGGRGQNLTIRIGYEYVTLGGRFVFNMQNPDGNFNFTNVNTASGTIAIRQIEL